MAKRKRRTFTDQFKADAVKLCEAGGRSIAQVAVDLDLTETALRDWVKRAAADAGKGPPGVLTTGEREELGELRKRVKRLETEREILKNYPRGCSHLLDEKLPRRYRGRGPGGAAGCFLETTAIPLKNMVQGLQRTWHW
jgi:transposase